MKKFNLFKKNKNDSTVVKELAIGQTFIDGSVQAVYYVDDKRLATDENINKCRKLEQISGGSMIFDAKLNVGIFKNDHSVDWGE